MTSALKTGGVGTAPESNASPTPEGRSMDDGRIVFPEGLLGFPEARDYRLAEGPAAGLFWLLADDDTGPTFLLSDPFVFFEDYGLDLSPSQAGRIQARDTSEVAVLAITIPGEGHESWTANLQGPIVINVREGLGTQLVLDDPSGLRRDFHPGLERKKVR